MLYIGVTINLKSCPLTFELDIAIVQDLCNNFFMYSNAEARKSRNRDKCNVKNINLKKDINHDKATFFKYHSAVQ